MIRYSLKWLTKLNLELLSYWVCGGSWTIFRPTTHEIRKYIIYQISPKYCYNPIKMKINAYATFAPQSPLKKFIYEREPTKNEIVISIKSCSLTRGDVRFIDNYWKDTTYPFIPGLEI